MPVWLTRRGWSVLGSAFALWLAWFGVGLRDLWYLIALLLALLLLALVGAVVRGILARVDIRVTTANPTPARGDTVALTATIAPGLGLAGSFRLVWAAGDAVRVLEPDDPEISRVDWEATGRGRVRVGIVAVQLLDPLGLAVRRVRMSAGRADAARSTVDLLVLPRLLGGLAERADELQPAAGAEDLSTRPVSLLDSGSPAGAVREYRSGDPRRQIHWKQSARQGELLVNLHETADAPERAVLLVTTAGAYPVGNGDPAGRPRAGAGESTGTEAFELAVSATATLALRWIRQGFSVRLQLGGERPSRCKTEGEVLRELAYARMAAGPESELWDPQGSGFRHAAPPHVVVTGSITAQLCAGLARLGGGGMLLAQSRRPGTEVPERWRAIGLSGRTDPSNGPSRSEPSAAPDAGVADPAAVRPPAVRHG